MSWSAPCLLWCSAFPSMLVPPSAPAPMLASTPVLGLAPVPVPEEGRLVEALLLMAVGMAVVFAALVLLLIAISAINRLGAAGEAGELRKAAVMESGQGQGQAVKAGEIQPQLIAVLAAAATMALQRPVEVIEARPVAVTARAEQAQQREREQEQGSGAQRA